MTEYKRQRKADNTRRINDRRKRTKQKNIRTEFVIVPLIQMRWWWYWWVVRRVVVAEVKLEVEKPSGLVISDEQWESRTRKSVTSQSENPNQNLIRIL